MRVLITGGAGLVGSECCRHFAREGHSVVSIDNFGRRDFFGSGGDTRPNMTLVLNDHPRIEHHELDVRNIEAIRPLLDGVDLVIHAAAQPSHPRSIEIPLEDFSVNAAGTLGLLEAVRQHRPEAVFVFCSTNKVYGDAPNQLPLVENETRFDFADGTDIDETMSLDQCMHTPFGVSKAAADLYTQEYARLYGMATGVFRMGCIAGAAAQAVEAHNWESHFMRVALAGETLTIHGHGGKQVRDVVHARDLARLFATFAAKPRPGAVYNIGGGRENSISLLEALDLIAEITGKPVDVRFGPAREGDHIVYISDLGRVKRDHGWSPRITVRQVFEEIHEFLSA